MPLIIHKVVAGLLLPLPLVCALVLVGILLRRRYLCVAGAALLYLCSVPLVSSTLLSFHEQRYAMVTPAACLNADAILVLSGTLDQNPATPWGFRWLDSVDRFEAGVRLFKLRKAPLLIFTGGVVPWRSEPTTEGQILHAEAIGRGVPDSGVVVIGPIQNTADEAKVLSEYVGARRMMRIILVTTAWHMPRAIRLFQKKGVDVIPFPVSQTRNPLDPFTPMDMIPSSKALTATEIAVRETIGSVY